MTVRQHKSGLPGDSVNLVIPGLQKRAANLSRSIEKCVSMRSRQGSVRTKQASPRSIVGAFRGSSISAPRSDSPASTGYSGRKSQLGVRTPSDPHGGPQGGGLQGGLQGGPQGGLLHGVLHAPAGAGLSHAGHAAHMQAHAGHAVRAGHAGSMPPRSVSFRQRESAPGGGGGRHMTTVSSIKEAGRCASMPAEPHKVRLSQLPYSLHSCLSGWPSSGWPVFKF